ncbi:Uncharacterised protein [Rhodococcus rhodochrous]|uniref:hypothetical protein n=1 Tax=Rhodococcus rhodochrous TaxID=1829 RepID=UPI0007507C57|nr:hypothetical protein [Rhodococcus rhodochrous]SNV25211.1 Uncharacterised protein [Rhodococcus rhodochrous]
MFERSIRDAELRRELGVPPTVDLVGHARDLARVAVPAALVAALAAVAVFFVRDSGPGVYESSLVAEIRSSASVSGNDATLGQLIAPYVALSQDSAVVAAIAAETNEDPAKLPSRIDVGYGSSPTLLTVTARDDSQADADRLAQTVVTQLDRAQTERNRVALDARIAELDAVVAGLRADLAASIAADEEGAADPVVQTELDARLEQLRQARSGASLEYLQVLSMPAGTGTKVSPMPRAEAAVAFLAVFVLVAELLVALNGRFGASNSPAWARRVARRHRTAVQIERDDRETLPLDTIVMLGQRASLGDHILLLTGEGVTVETDAFGDARDRIVCCGVGEQWWTRAKTEGLALAVIVLQAGAEERAQAEDTLRALAEIEVPTRLVVLGAGRELVPVLPARRRETAVEAAPEPPAPVPAAAPAPAPAPAPAAPAPRPVPDDRHRAPQPVPSQPVPSQPESLFVPPQDSAYRQYRYDEGHDYGYADQQGYRDGHAHPEQNGYGEPRETLRY